MSKNKIVEIYRIFFGVLIFVAIFYQLYSMKDSPTYNLINYVSYFTVLSNFFVATTLIFTGIRSDKNIHFDMARGASTLYILITGLGFIFLLGGDNEQLLPWVNIVLHYIAPIVMLLDWAIEPLFERINFSRALSWIAPPYVYFGFALLRGQSVNWYPYDFLDPRITSWIGITSYTAIVTISSIMLIWILIKVARVRI